MSRDFEIEYPPELEPLARALAECGIQKRNIPLVAVRLTEPSELLHRTRPEIVEAQNSLLQAVVDFDENLAAQMLQRTEGRPAPGVTWKGLSPAERKRAKRLWDRTLDAGVESSAQGRPSVVDGALVLYCTRVLEEAGGLSFGFSRPAAGGAPTGPWWRALMVAYPIAQSFIAGIDGPNSLARREIRPDAETIRDIVRTARSKQFKICTSELNLGPTAADVAEHPAAFRQALMVARARRRVRPK
jgi:hypothetical protein